MAPNGAMAIPNISLANGNGNANASGATKSGGTTTGGGVRASISMLAFNLIVEFLPWIAIKLPRG